MTALLLSALGLAVAGMDPAGALVVVAALAAGARARDVVGFAVAVLVVTPVVGTVLAVTVGRGLAGVEWSRLMPTGRAAEVAEVAGAVVELAVGAVLLVWAANRVASRDRSPRRPRSTRPGLLGLVTGGLLFAAGAVLDPTFVAVVVLTGRDEPLAVVVAAHVIWVLVSQAPLVVILAVVVRGRHERAVAWFADWWARVERAARPVITIALVLAGGLLLTDAVWWFASGDFLIPVPS